MQEFIKQLKKGKFKVPICKSCSSRVWPPSHYCPYCLSKTSLKTIETTGILLEFTKSNVKNKKGIFGLVEMSGIKLVGSFGPHHLREGMEVRMSKCGIMSDGTTFYSFAPTKA